MMNLERLTEKGRSALSSANELAKHDNHSQIEPAHLLAALLNQEGGVVQQVISKVGGSLAAAQRVIVEEIERMPRIYGGSEPGISPRLRQVFEAAWSEMGQFHDEYLSVEHLLLALFDAGDEATARVLRAAGLTRENVLQALTSIRGAQRVTDQNPEGTYQALEKYGRNLTELAAQGKLDPVIGRDEEIRRVIQVLSRRTKNNPVLIGEPGVGKTAIVEGLAQRIVWRRQSKFGQYLFSLVLDFLAGYGYRPSRSVMAYLIVIFGFMGLYLLNAHAATVHLNWDEALVLSVSSFHGRGFFLQNVSLGDTFVRLAAAEAVLGLLIEISFIATFTQRFFGR